MQFHQQASACVQVIFKSMETSGSRSGRETGFTSQRKLSMLRLRQA
jgi:hypothetical protein